MSDCFVPRGCGEKAHPTFDALVDKPVPSIDSISLTKVMLALSAGLQTVPLLALAADLALAAALELSAVYYYGI